MKYLVLYCFLSFSFGISFLSFDLSAPAPRTQEIFHQSCRIHSFPPSLPFLSAFFSLVSTSPPSLFLSAYSAHLPTTYLTHHLFLPHPLSLSAHHHRCGVTRSNRLIITALHIHTRTRHHITLNHITTTYHMTSIQPTQIASNLTSLSVSVSNGSHKSPPPPILQHQIS
jgi:hypothetical protein